MVESTSLNTPDFMKESITLFQLSPIIEKSQTKTALELYHEEVLNGCILSYNEKLDLVLKDVIVPKTITEFAGESGSGKTQLCFQMCITVQLPKLYGGFGGEALYINANNNFSSHRIRELTKNFIHRHKTLKTHEMPQHNAFDEDTILKHIHYIRVKDCLELIATIELLDEYLKEKNIKVLVIDSISYLLRYVDVKLRKTILCRIFCNLRSLASSYNFAVIITNDLTTRVNEGQSYVTPSFGDSFYHLINNRLLFSKRYPVFHIKLVKGIHRYKRETVFCIN